MQTFKQEFKEGYSIAELTQDWQSRLSVDCSEQTAATRESIIRWLLGDLKRFEIDQTRWEIAQQAMDYRYRLLRQRYLGLEPLLAYRHLTSRLGSLVLQSKNIRTWVSLSRDRQQTVVNILTAVIQELLTSDRYMQQQIAWIAECSGETKLRNALLFASTEEYCLQPVCNQPLLVYRFVDYLRRTARGGLTQLSSNDLLRMVTEKILSEERENPLSLVNNQAVAKYQDAQAMAEQQARRAAAKQEFESYLAEHIGPVAVQWLQLYLQGQSTPAGSRGQARAAGIARSLNLEIRQVEQLREKINHHAVSSLVTHPINT